MDSLASNIVTISNAAASVSVDALGGAIIDFHLHAGNINPLSFKLPLDKMPENNRSGAVYQGHFACIGRWGQPSAGEVEAGLPNHGQAANLPWKIRSATENELQMDVNAPLDGLYISRVLALDTTSPVFTVRERIKNTNTLGRLYNIVQHPTIAAPFLDENTIVNCNASAGFSCFGDDDLQHVSAWPKGICEDGKSIDLNNPHKGDGFSVFAFVVNEDSDIGWLTAWSPTHNLLLGYLWDRFDYPWINLWQDYADGKLKNRGLEFGTTGIHKPFHEILQSGHINVLGEKTINCIDAGAEIERSYCAFLINVPGDFKGVEAVSLIDGNILIKPNKSREMINLSTNYKIRS